MNTKALKTALVGGVTFGIAWTIAGYMIYDDVPYTGAFCALVYSLVSYFLLSRRK